MIGCMSSNTDRAWELEEQLLQPEVRADASQLETLLAPGFREIGGSGRMWSRPEMIESLTQDPSLPASLDISEQQAVEIDSGLVLLTYRMRSDQGESRRSSLWQLTAYGSSLLFHQGTPIPGD